MNLQNSGGSESGQVSMMILFAVLILYAVYFCGNVAWESYKRSQTDAAAAAAQAANPYHIPYAY